MLHASIDWILTTVGDWGYLGIFVLMAMESTVLPVPSELVVIPAGDLAYQGKMSLVLILASTRGSLAGGNATLIQDNLPLVTAAVLGFVALTLAGYYLWRRLEG